MSNLLRLLFSSFPSSSGFPAGKRNLKTTCSVVQFWEGFAHSNSMTEHSIRIRFIFTYVDNKMVSVQFSSPFQTDPPSQYTYDVQSNTAFLFLWAAVVCLSWFCLVFFSGQLFCPDFVFRTVDATLKFSGNRRMFLRVLLFFPLTTHQFELIFMLWINRS